MYTATYANRRTFGNSAEVTIILQDDAATFPTARIEKSFAGKTAAQLTAAFLDPIAKVEAARLIQTYHLNRANVVLDTKVLTEWLATVVPALVTAEANMRATMAGLGISPATIAAKIVTDWTAYGVNGLITAPTVTVAITRPDATSMNHDFNGSN